jgi:NAD(P)-dependent dehydrogenase (short-subunit alcohol dehydrogenase family)
VDSSSFRYDGKRALVVGGATGMGRATAALVQDLGAEVVVMDWADVTLPGVKSIKLDLRSKESIDAAIDECGGPVHALFSCAGVADGTEGLERINFLGHRHMIERMVAEAILGRGAAIAFISSAAGLGWENNIDTVNEYLATPDFETGARWAVDNLHADYMFSKMAICTYVARQAFPLLKQGIRINAILPGPTDTPLARANADLWLGHGKDYRDDTGTEASTPEEQAGPLAFLNSDAARYVTGETIITDLGYVASGVTRAYPSAGDVVGFLRTKFW